MKDQAVQPRAAIYVRVSTKKESQKDSPEHQEGICREKARQLGLIVPEDGIYEDRDTGTNIMSRPAITRLIADVKQKKFDAVIFASLSRFSRDTLDSISLKRTFVNTLGIRLISIDEGYDSFIQDDELKFQIISAVNQKLSEQISLSSRRGIRQSALKGNFIGSIAPYGYKKVKIGDRKTLEIVEEHAEIVRLIFHLYTAHQMGEKQIVHVLNKEKKIPSPKDGVWGITTIQRILQNEAYTGVNVFGKYERKTVYHDAEDLSDRSRKLVRRDERLWERAHNPVTHEPIVSIEIFELAKEIRRLRGGGRRGGVRNCKNVFAGFIHCAHCGAAMVSMKSKSRSDQEYRYLICSKRRRSGDAGCANGFWLPYYRFKEDVFLSLVSSLAESSTVDSLLAKYKDLIRVDRQVGDKQISRLKKSIEMNRQLLFELRKQKMQGLLDEKQFVYERKKYEAEIENSEQQLEQLGYEARRDQDEQELYDDVREALEDLLTLHFDDAEEFDELRFVIRKLIHRITVDKQGNISIHTTFRHPNRVPQAAAGRDAAPV